MQHLQYIYTSINIDCRGTNFLIIYGSINDSIKTRKIFDVGQIQ